MEYTPRTSPRGKTSWPCPNDTPISLHTMQYVLNTAEFWVGILIGNCGDHRRKTVVSFLHRLGSCATGAVCTGELESEGLGSARLRIGHWCCDCTSHNHSRVRRGSTLSTFPYAHLDTAHLCPECSFHQMQPTRRSPVLGGMATCLPMTPQFSWFVPHTPAAHDGRPEIGRAHV